jgi:hypothetical protein
MTPFAWRRAKGDRDWCDLCTSLRRPLLMSARRIFRAMSWVPVLRACGEGCAFWTSMTIPFPIGAEWRTWLRQLRAVVVACSPRASGFGNSLSPCHSYCLLRQRQALLLVVFDRSGPVIGGRSADVRSRIRSSDNGHFGTVCLAESTLTALGKHGDRALRDPSSHRWACGGLLAPSSRSRNELPSIWPSNLAFASRNCPASRLAASSSRCASAARCSAAAA